MRRSRCTIQSKNGICFSMYIRFLASIDGHFSYQTNWFCCCTISANVGHSQSQNICWNAKWAMIVNVKRLTIIQVLLCAFIKIREGSQPKRHGGFQREHLSVTYPLQQAKREIFCRRHQPKRVRREGTLFFFEVKVITPTINHAQWKTKLGIRY